MSVAREIMEDVAIGTARIASKVIVGGGLLLVATQPLAAQQMPLGGPRDPAAATATLPKLEEAGKVAADLCIKRGDRTADCVRDERNKLVAVIGSQARADADKARADADKARADADKARADADKARAVSQQAQAETSANLETLACRDKLKLASGEQLRDAKAAAGVTERITADKYCAVANKLPQRGADASLHTGAKQAAGLTKQ